MRFLSTVFLILVCCGAMRPASAQTISYLSIPCAGCATQADLGAAANTFFQKYMEKTPPGYVGLVEPPPGAPNLCEQGASGATTLLVASTTTSLIGTFYGCYEPTVKGGGKIEYRAIASGIAVSILPKYQIASVYYAPPGAKSNVVYGSSYTQSTNNAFSNTFSVANQVSLGFSEIANKGDSATVTVGWSQSSTTSDSVTVSTTTSENLQIPGPSSSKNGIDHTQDLIYVWLNPGVTVNVFPSVELQVAGINYDGSDPDQGMDIYPLSVANLEALAAGGSPPGVDMTRLARAWSPTGALTPADYQSILAADPFATNPNYNPATDNRFDSLVQTINYTPADSGGGPITTAYNGSYSTTSTAGQSATDMHSVQVAVSSSIPLGSTTVEADLKAQTTWTWTNTWSTLQTSTNGQTANFSIVSPLPTDGYPGPTAIAVYKDNVYGTFMFYGEL
jgi:hypothetical protein